MAIFSISSGIKWVIGTLMCVTKDRNNEYAFSLSAYANNNLEVMNFRISPIIIALTAMQIFQIKDGIWRDHSKKSGGKIA